MGRLFENVTMDIQAERRNTAEARAELSAAHEKLETTQYKLDMVQQELEQEREIYKHILRMSRQRCSDAEILASLRQHFILSEEQAKAKLQEAFED